MTNEEYSWLEEEGKRLGALFVSQSLPYDEFMKRNASSEYFRLLEEEKSRIDNLNEQGIMV